MSDSTSEASGMAAAPASEGSPVTGSDILVAESSSVEVLAGAVAAGEIPSLSGASVEDSIPVASDGGKLELVDVLASDGTDPNLGAFLTVDTIGGNTVISIGAEGSAYGASVQVVTLEGVTGMTLQDLLTSSQITG